jgi:cation:H+ antiporter
MYVVLFYFIEKKDGLLVNVREEINVLKDKHAVEDLIELVLACVIVFITSHYIVDQTIYFSQLFNISSFLISVIVLSLGTNLPELSLAIRSVLEGKREVALGDYLGSAAANTLLFGIFTLLNGSRINVESYSYKTMAMMLLGLGLFYWFSRSKQDISRREGKILLTVYVLFLVVEIFLQ